MRANEVALQVPELIVGDALAGQRAEAGVDPVVGAAIARGAIDDVAGLLQLSTGDRRDLDRGVAGCNRLYGVDR